MPYYLYQGRFTRDAMQALVDHPQDRSSAARKIIEAAGGKLHHYLFSFGSGDVVVISEFPDNASAAAVSMAVAVSGTLEQSQSTTLLTMDEAVSAMKQAKDILGDYQPPHR